MPYDLVSWQLLRSLSSLHLASSWVHYRKELFSQISRQSGSGCWLSPQLIQHQELLQFFKDLEITISMKSDLNPKQRSKVWACWLTWIWRGSYQQTPRSAGSGSSRNIFFHFTLNWQGCGISFSTTDISETLCSTWSAQGGSSSVAA